MEKHVLALQLSHLLGEEFSREWVYSQIEIPKKDAFGDLSFPCFLLAKTFRKSPPEIAMELAPQLKHELFSNTEAKSGYINIHLTRSFISSHTLKQVLSEKENYGSHEFGKGKTIVLDMSAPNIAKPFSMGHLRSTVIGESISRLAQKCGYHTVKINYIGDYGTQFGKLLAAYKRWGDKQTVQTAPLKELTKLYVKFHEAVKEDPSLLNEGREWFKKLENRDSEALELWHWFKGASLEQFERIYQLLGITFDLTRGEAYYNDKMDATVDLLKHKGIVEESEGAQVVRLDEEGLPPCLIRKSDGTTIYATRDLTAVLDRYHTYHFDEALYVVGQEQTLHFQQIKQVLRKADLTWAEKVKHISFGMMLKDGKKMSTRQGKTVLLEDVLNEAIQQARENIETKNPTLENKDKVARQVGVGAVIFHDLKHDRRNDIEFSLKDMLTFEGSTAPYLQYTFARANTLLQKGNFQSDQALAEISDDEAWAMIKLIRQFPGIVHTSFKKYDPSKLAKYLLDLAKEFNHYYATVKIIGSEKETSRLTLIYAFSLVLKEGLSLLGIEAPDHM